ncbi:hypothetical protein LQE88_03660 [Acidaminococcus sp. NSJ-142]|uniref:hypothetical protein n=1 Tax=Acidaminococcus TaxID=904 RepID=UPI001E5DE9CA|nr:MULTISPECIES: hypothetical protein [Acidaminococcus]MCD2435093.1 hypothetical protein [Acidaminococcus hominis]
MFIIIVYLRYLPKQQYLQLAHLLVLLPAGNPQQLEPFPVLYHFCRKPGSGSRLSLTAIGNFSDQASLIPLSLKSLERLDVSCHIFIHSAISVPLFSFLFNSFLKMVNVFC